MIQKTIVVIFIAILTACSAFVWQKEKSHSFFGYEDEKLTLVLYRNELPFGTRHWKNVRNIFLWLNGRGIGEYAFTLQFTKDIIFLECTDVIVMPDTINFDYNGRAWLTITIDDEEITDIIYLDYL
jgi:hypothetical protein